MSKNFEIIISYWIENVNNYLTILINGFIDFQKSESEY